MSTRAPWFPLYPKDWLSSPAVQMMTAEQEGGYFRLLCYCWDSGDCSLVDDDDVLAKLSRLNEGWFNGGAVIIRKCFIPHPEKPSFLTNARMLQEGMKQKSWSEKSSIGGKKSAEKRKQSKGGSTVVEAKGNLPIPPPSPSPHLIKQHKRYSPPEDYSPEFDSFWEGWKPFEMTKGDKRTASIAYIKARKKIDHETLIRTRDQYLANCYTIGCKSQHASTWLNRDGWLSDEGIRPIERQTFSRTGGSEKGSVTALFDSIMADVTHG